VIALRRVSDEVFYADAGIVRLGAAEIDFLRARAAESPRGRARICAHLDPADGLHEMLIALRRGGYVRPHRHVGREESFHAVDGEADVVIFDDMGGIEQVIPMGAGADDTRIYRLNTPRFHTVLVRTPCFIVHEVTRGPFDPDGTVFAPWTPPEGDTPGVAMFLAALESRLQER
jgi:cupin fold WbuC family metalloprotein